MALEQRGFTSTFKWEEAFAAGLLKPADVTALTELRIVRNRLVHSNTTDAEETGYWATRSSQVLKDLERRLVGNQGRRRSGQRQAWMAMNGGEDARGSRRDDDHARAIVGRHGGVPVALGYRFPDGSVLRARRGVIIASPDPSEWMDSSEEVSGARVKS